MGGGNQRPCFTTKELMMRNHALCVERGRQMRDASKMQQVLGGSLHPLLEEWPGSLSAVGLVPLHRFAKVPVGIRCCSGFFACIVAVFLEVVGRLQNCASTWNGLGISLITFRTKYVGVGKW